MESREALTRKCVVVKVRSLLDFPQIRLSQVPKRLYGAYSAGFASHTSILIYVSLCMSLQARRSCHNIPSVKAAHAQHCHACSTYPTLRSAEP